MSSKQTVEIHELERKEIDEVLSRNNVGRVGFSWRDRVSIEPLGYVYSDGWIWGRTSPGRKLVTIKHNYWVAFEVDEVEGPYDWRSVLVHGGFYQLTADGRPQDTENYQRGLELLREAAPETLRPEDPVPFRSVLFRIAAQELTGRRSTVSSGS